MLDRAIAIGERSLGPDHPVVAKALVSKARAVFWESGPATALPLLERALAIQEAKLGEHQDVAATLNLLGMMRHPSPEAIEFYQRAIVITEKEYGPEHPFVAPPLYNLAEIAVIAGDFEKAVELQTRATDVRRKVFGAADGFYKSYAGRLALMELAAGHLDRARERLEEKAREADEAVPKGYCDLATPLLLGELALREGDPVRARAEVDRALALTWRCDDGVNTYAGLSHFGNWVLARALWDLPEH
jgi:tetratricopeptide (TPR) repeat protein